MAIYNNVVRFIIWRTPSKCKPSILVKV